VTRRLTNALAGLYSLVGCGQIGCAMVSLRNDAPHYAAFFLGTAVALATAVVHHSFQRDELRYAHAQLDRAERAARPPTSAADAVVAVAMAGWCCDAWAATAGADHDPATCTRKDQTT
jgi:hypothetical protein